MDCPICRAPGMCICQVPERRPAPASGDDFQEKLKNYSEWHKSAYGWHPWEDLTCAHCKKPVPLIKVFRCYDCGMPMHQDCCKSHCEESKNHAPDRT